MVKNKKDNSLLLMIFLSVLFTTGLFLISLYFQNQARAIVFPSPSFTPYSSP